MANTGNGNKVIVLNTRERVLSTDANRAQLFYGQGMADLLRFMLDAETEESRFGGSTEVMSDGTEVPPKSYIVNGIRPFPVNGTTSLLISPGVMALVDNPADPNTDDSVASWIVDPGIQTTGVLTLPANASGMTIIGVVECQRATVVLEQDNRDIFNVATGLFSPILVNKVTAGQLTYRIRLGTPGAGFPGVVAEWVPLVVFNQPAAATTWDDVLLMWDVRRLINDRWNAPFNTPLNVSELTKGYGYTDLQTVGQSRLYSEVDANYLEARAGGRLGLNSPNPAATGFFDILLASNQTGNFAGYTAHRFWSIYAIFPFGLPRWQLYSALGTPSPRRPIGPRGIPAITGVGPVFSGVPLTNISTPTATGLLDAPSQSAVVLVSGKIDNVGPAPLPVNLDGHVVWSVNNDGTDTIAPTAAVAPNYSEFTFTDNTTHPGNVRAIYVRFDGRFELDVPDVLVFSNKVLVSNPDAVTSALSECFHGSAQSASVVAALLQERAQFVARIPFAPGVGAPGFAAQRTFKIRWQYDYQVAGAAVVTVTNVFARLIGWEPGP